jgi:riboflavin kinase/FMN adenylyltransferase
MLYFSYVKRLALTLRIGRWRERFYTNMTQVEEELAQFTLAKETVLTIGIFDGVHLGHKALLAKLKEQARQLNALAGVVTFRYHPDELMSHQKSLPYLTSLNQRIALLKAEGIDLVVTLTFNPELASLEANEFVSLLTKHLKMRGLVVGPDFALGKGRQGDINYLRKLGRGMGFTVTTVPPVTVNNEIVSSTAIRKALAEGDMKRVRNLTGHYFSFTGTVVKGEERGRKLGFPTANLDVHPRQALPPFGIYATLAHIDGKTYQSVTSIGIRPTFSEGRRTIEVYILDFAKDIYGKELKVDFIEKLRDEKRFNSMEDLAKQITEDVKQGKAILNSLGKK